MIDANSKKLSGYLPYAYNIFACTYVYYIFIYDHIAYKIVFMGIPDISIKTHSSQQLTVSLTKRLSAFLTADFPQLFFPQLQLTAAFSHSHSQTKQTLPLFTTFGWTAAKPPLCAWVGGCRGGWPWPIMGQCCSTNCDDLHTTATWHYTAY